ncbi:hypothetical protein QMG83_03055 [Salinibacterium sp. G-O1]|uniref:hypothetical protein n=1 Tax=Salinibacterium sp. G-O1 TaxID=3046208 RepID=UPI0024BAD982|nr:hypothetical protein [Salinibacterium sp. G-O1]MDJ0334197.1 hypothetical protein [Salinibacterium sp. G-O1]
MTTNTPDNEIPPVPVPPVTPPPPAPVEPAPAAAAPPAPLPPVSPAPPAPAAARPDPYAAPGQTAPYASPAAAPQPNPYAPVAAGPVQTLSIVAMIVGILGVLMSFVGLGFLPALAAVIMGHLAQKRQPWAKPFWVTALVTGYVGLGISLIAGLFFLFVFIAASSGSSF